MGASAVDVDAVHRLIDRQAIVDVLHAYCRNVDLARPGEVAALFTTDCSVDYGPAFGPPTEGAAELERRLGSALRRFAATSHHLSNVEVDLDPAGEAAATVAYVYAWHRYDDERPDAHVWARYHDRFVRTAEGWRIAERVLRVAGEQGFDVDWHPVGRTT